MPTTKFLIRLIWVFAGRTLIMLVLSCRGSCHIVMFQIRMLADTCGTFTNVSTLTQLIVELWFHFHLLEEWSSLYMTWLVDGSLSWEVLEKELGTLILRWHTYFWVLIKANIGNRHQQKNFQNCLWFCFLWDLYYMLLSDTSCYQILTVNF